MNSLPWLLYAADVAGSAGAISAVVGVASGLGFVFAATAGRGIVQGCNDEEEAEEVRRSISAKTLKASIIGLLLTAVLPSTNTIYAIAAIQVSEDALATPTGTKAMKALDAWLDRQIAGEVAEPSK